jgi:hypothetical protein
MKMKNLFVNIFKKSFTYKNNPHLISFGELNKDIDINKANTSVKKILERYKLKHNILRSDLKDFIEYSPYYKNSSDLKYTLHALAFILRLDEKNTDVTPLMHRIALKNYKDIIFNNLGEINIKDFNEIYTELIAIKNYSKNCLFILSEAFERFLCGDYLLANAADKKFINENKASFLNLRNLPKGKQIIGNFLSQYFRDKSKAKIDLETIEFLLHFEGYLDKDLLDSIKYTTNTMSYNIQQHPNIYLTKLDNFINQPFNQSTLINFTEYCTNIAKLLETCDGRTSMELLDTIYKKLGYIKANHKLLRYSFDLVGITNTVIKNYLKPLIKNESFNPEILFTLRSIMLFYSRNYPHFKTYNYTANKGLIKTFKNYHKNLFDFFGLLKNFNDLTPSSAFSLLDILRYNSTNLVQSDAVEQFLAKNLDLFLSIDYKEADIRNYKYISNLIFALMNTKFTNDKVLDEVLIKFIDASDIMIQYGQHSGYLSNLTSILYNLLLLSYKNEEIVKKLYELCLKFLKIVGNQDMSSINRILLINQNLELVYPKISENYANKIATFTSLHKKLNKSQANIKSNIWWDKNNFSLNKYSIEYITNILSDKHKSVILYPQVGTVYYTDYILDNSKYIEFIGPYHTLNTINIEDSIISPKYSRKLEILKSRGISVTNINFDEIISDINLLNKF